MTVQCVRPTFAGKFRCDGTACGSLCCTRGWRIIIDGVAYRNYEAMEKSGEMEFLPHIQWDPEKEQGTMLCRDGRCPFLGQDMLCGIQKKYGPDLLSDTCALYPRVTRAVGGVVVQTMSMTCPVAAKMALGGEAPMDFEAVWLEPHRDKVEYQIFPENYPKGVLKHFFTLQTAAISILQDRTRTLNQRLIRLGFLLGEADGLIRRQRADKLPRLARSGPKSSVPGAPPPLGACYPRRMAELIALLYQNIGEFRESPAAYLGVLFQAYPALGEAGQEDALAAQYETALAKTREKLKSWSCLLENYIVNEYFARIYPFAFEDTIPRNYFTFALICRLLEFFLVAMASESPGASEEDVLRLIARYDLRVRHLDPYIGRIRRFAQRYGDDVKPFMAELLDGRDDRL